MKNKIEQTRFFTSVLPIFLIFQFAVLITACEKNTSISTEDKMEIWVEKFKPYHVSEDFSEFEDVKKGVKGIASISFIGGDLNDEAISELVLLKPDLYGLHIGKTQITDRSLELLAVLSDLQVLDVSGNAITDSGLESISKLKQLRHLKLDEVNITDLGLAYLGKLPNLKSLTLYKTAITGSGFNGFPIAESKLEILSMPNSNLNDKGVIALERFKNLTYLEITNTKISEHALSSLGKLTNIQSLFLQSTSITNNSLKHLVNLKKLEGLILDHTPLSDDSVSILSKITSLKVLSLIGTNFSKMAINELRQAMPNSEITSSFTDN